MNFTWWGFISAPDQVKITAKKKYSLSGSQVSEDDDNNQGGIEKLLWLCLLDNVPQTNSLYLFFLQVLILKMLTAELVYCFRGGRAKVPALAGSYKGHRIKEYPV